MRFPAVAFAAIVGGFLVFGGTLLGSPVTRWIGFGLWIVGALILFYGAAQLGIEAWRDWRSKRYIAALRKRHGRSAPRYKQNVRMK